MLGVSVPPPARVVWLQGQGSLLDERRRAGKKKGACLAGRSREEPGLVDVGKDAGRLSRASGCLMSIWSLSPYRTEHQGGDMISRWSDNTGMKSQENLVCLSHQTEVVNVSLPFVTISLH